MGEHEYCAVLRIDGSSLKKDLKHRKKEEKCLQ